MSSSAGPTGGSSAQMKAFPPRPPPSTRSSARPSRVCSIASPSSRGDTRTARTTRASIGSILITRFTTEGAELLQQRDRSGDRALLQKIGSRDEPLVQRGCPNPLEEPAPSGDPQADVHRPNGS